MSVRKGDDVLAGGAPIRIDSALSTTSANPVQNSVITAALQTVDEALANKQDNISAGDGITIAGNTVAVGNLDCGTMS